MSEPTSKPPSSPPRPVHQINRSISEVSPPSLKLYQPHHHQHHIHTPHHHAHLHSRRARSSDKNKEREPQSAHPSLQPFLSGGEGKERNWRDIGQARSEGVTPSGSRDTSRRTSVFGAWESDGGPGSGAGVVGGVPFLGKERRVVKEGEVKEERERGVLRATELRNSLANLNTLSNNTTRRLDITYYSVLEKLSSLQNSISSLKELAIMTRAIKNDFKIESEEVVREISGQVEGYKNFNSQEQRIKSLQERVQEGREKIKILGGRVEVVKERLEGWEKAEGEWQNKTRKRLRILWIVMSVVAAVVVGLVVFRYTPARTHDPGVMKGLNASELMGRIPNFDEVRNETWTLKREAEGVLEGLKRRQGEVLKEDPRLRVFDEL